MIIHLDKNINPQQKEAIDALLAKNKVKAMEVTTQSNQYLVAVLNKEIDIRLVGKMPGVADVHRVTDGYKLVSRKWKVNPTQIDLGDGVVISENDFTLMAGPCSIEGEEQIEKIAAQLVKNNVRIMRGGVYKPRSSPYAFRGMGIEGLKLFYSICRSNGIDRKSVV